MSSELFIKAARKKWRFPSKRGDLSVEQLWDFPLLGVGAQAGSDLNTVAIALDDEIGALGRRSFVQQANPEKAELEQKLDLVKFIIDTKKAEAANAEKRAHKAEERRKIMAALSEKNDAELRGASKEELLRRLDALDAE